LFQFIVWLSIIVQHLAERMGFEPMIRFWHIHTFQACAFDHSAISPNRLKFTPLIQFQGAKIQKNEVLNRMMLNFTDYE
jgi:hypothetical protein